MMSPLPLRHTSVHVQLLSLGLGLFILALIPPLHRHIEQVRVIFIHQTDVLIQKPWELVQTFHDVVTFSSLRGTQAQAIEAKNRNLYALLASCQQSLLQASHSAEPTSTISLDKLIPSVLSFSGGQWIVLSGSGDGVREGDVVLEDGVFLGKVQAVHATYSSIETLASASVPFLVMHEKSKTAGILRPEKQLTVQFSKRIESLEPHDLFLTVPDGEHTHGAYAAAELDSVTSGATDSSSSVTVHALADPYIGSTVHIIVAP